MVQPKRPSLFRNKSAPRSRMRELGKALEKNTVNAGVEALQKTDPEDIDVKVMPNYLKVTQDRLDKMEVIDLKPFFARSSKRKQKRGGGWYLTVPLSVKTRDMSRRMYDQLRSVDISPQTSKTVMTDYLYDRRRESDATMLNYTPKSKNITKQKSGKNRHTYTAFRTVSDKSPASSWIINRGKANKSDTSKTFVRNVDNLMKWRMKNM